MRRLVLALAVTLAVVTARPALAACPDDSDCPQDAGATLMPYSPPDVDDDGDAIPYVQEVDAPEPGTALVDGNLY